MLALREHADLVEVPSGWVVITPPPTGVATRFWLLDLHAIGEVVDPVVARELRGIGRVQLHGLVAVIGGADAAQERAGRVALLHAGVGIGELDLEVEHLVVRSRVLIAQHDGLIVHGAVDLAEILRIVQRDRAGLGIVLLVLASLFQRW